MPVKAVQLTNWSESVPRSQWLQAIPYTRTISYVFKFCL